LGTYQSKKKNKLDTIDTIMETDKNANRLIGKP
jgi:hypothetical protein